MSSYAVKWREPDGATYLGRLELARNGLVLHGRSGEAEPVRRTIGYGDVRGSRIGRDDLERLDGRAALVVERPGGHLLVGALLGRAGELQELAHRLAEHRAHVRRRE